MISRWLLLTNCLKEEYALFLSSDLECFLAISFNFFWNLGAVKVLSNSCCKANALGFVSRSWSTRWTLASPSFTSFTTFTSFTSFTFSSFASWTCAAIWTCADPVMPLLRRGERLLVLLRSAKPKSNAESSKSSKHTIYTYIYMIIICVYIKYI